MPITTTSDGTALCVVVPLSSIYGGYLNNGPRLPFASVASNTNFPFLAAPIYSPAGPFQNQVANFVTYNTDACILDFIQT